MYLLYVRGIRSTFFAVTDTKLFTFFMGKIITNCKNRKAHNMKILTTVPGVFSEVYN